MFKAEIIIIQERARVMNRDTCMGILSVWVYAKCSKDEECPHIHVLWIKWSMVFMTRLYTSLAQLGRDRIQELIQKHDPEQQPRCH